MIPMDDPVRQISYRIFSPNPFEDTGERWTTDETEAQAAYDRGFIVDKIDIVRVVVSTGQTVTTGLSTEWRGK